MVPKLIKKVIDVTQRFRAVLFRMVPKPEINYTFADTSFRAVLFRMVPKQQGQLIFAQRCVLELCCFEWFQNPCH